MFSNHGRSCVSCVVLALLIVVSPWVLATDFVLDPVAEGSLYVNYDLTPVPTADDVVVGTSPLISRRITVPSRPNDIEIAVLEFALPTTMNPQGFFGDVRLSGRIQANNSNDTGVRTILPWLIEGDGVVNGEDGFHPPFFQALFEDWIRYQPPAEFSVDFDIDVYYGLREAAELGYAGVAATFLPQNEQSYSVVTDLQLTIDRYFADPYDAIPAINESSGLAFAGHRGDWVSQGETQLIEGEGVTFSARRNFDNGIRISVNGDDYWSVDFATPDHSDLQPGDRFEAMRIPFQDPGVAGFDFSGGGRGENTLDATFEIVDVQYGGDGEVLLLDALFEQRGEGREYGVYGRILYDALAGVLVGDFNGSGQVEQGDLDLVLQNWGVDTDTFGEPTAWVYDLPHGQIEQTELDKVLSNWGSTASPDFSLNPGVVPEPMAALVVPVTFLWRGHSQRRA